MWEVGGGMEGGRDVGGKGRVGRGMWEVGWELEGGRGKVGGGVEGGRKVRGRGRKGRDVGRWGGVHVFTMVCSMLYPTKPLHGTHTEAPVYPMITHRGIKFTPEAAAVVQLNHGKEST